MVDDVIGSIRRAVPSLSTGESKIADMVLTDPLIVVNHTVNEVAEMCKTSPATVARFSQTLGYSGYRQFRLAVAASLSRAQAELDRFEINDDEIDPTDGVEDVISKVLYQEVLAVEQTLRGLDRDKLDLAAQAMVRAPRIEICGFGASGLTAQDLFHKLGRIGRPSGYSPDVHLALPAASLLEKNSVLVVFSHSGETREALEVTSVASDAGATIVAVTNSPKSSLAALSDVTLLTQARESRYRSGAMASRTAQHTIVDVLFVRVTQQLFDASSHSLRRTYEAVHGRNS